MFATDDSSLSVIFNMLRRNFPALTVICNDNVFCRLVSYDIPDEINNVL